MPRRHGSSVSLFEDTLSQIVRKLDWWIPQPKDEIEYRDVIGPFENLPPIFVEHILRKGQEMNLLKKHHLQVLIDGRLATLDLSNLSSTITAGLGKMISHRWRNIGRLFLR